MIMSPLIALRSKTKIVAPASGAVLLEKLQRNYSHCNSTFTKRQTYPQDSTSFTFRRTSIDAKHIFPLARIPMKLSPPAGGRPLSTSATSDHIIDEHKIDCMLHERELQMHRHPLGPVKKITNLWKSALKGRHQNADIKILDLDSQPTDASVKLAKELPEARVHFISVSAENVRAIADEATELDLPNIITEQSDACNLEQFSDGSLDLVISCYGLQKHPHPKTMVDEIHRVLKPGGTLIVAAWDHLGTEPIVNKMMASVIKGRDAKVKDSLPLTPSLTTPHIVEKMIEDSGLSCIKIDRGEYPLYLSRDRSPNSAFDLVSLPIKNKLGSLMMSGERPRAFEDARAAFDKMIAAKEIRKDANGRFVIDDNRFKILVARREYEDEDALKKIEKEKAATESKKNLVPATAPIPLDTIAKFDELLETSFRHRYLPMSHFHKAIRHVVDVEGNADTKKISVMDLGSRPAKITPASFLADAFPEASIHSVDVSSAATTPEEGVKSDTRALEIEIVKLGTKLSSVPDKSIDIITCAFGLQYIEDLDSIMNQVHRVLKPGGSFIATSWDSISLEHISNRILAEVVGTTSVSVLAPFMDIAKFAEPHFLEKLVEHGGLNVMKSEHYEFPFVLEADGIVDDNTFDTAVLPIRHILNNLEESGSRPHALSDARGAFDRMIEKGELLSIDDHGCLITDANRFNIVVARRLFEDSDGIWTME